MSTRGRSASQTPPLDGDVNMNIAPSKSPDAKVVVVTNLTRNVVEAHLQTIFGFYGTVFKIDLPLYGKSGQNRGKAAVEYMDSDSAHKAVSHMNGGQVDGAIVKVELSDLPVRTRSRSPRARGPRNGRDRPRSLSRSRSRSPARFPRRDYPRYGDPYRRPPPRRPPMRDTYRPRSRTRSRSPIRRGGMPPRRRSPSYERGGYGRRGRSRSASYSVRSSRSRSRSFSPSRSRSRSRSASYSSYSRYSRSRSRSRSYGRGRRSFSRDDIRDSRSRSPVPANDA